MPPSWPVFIACSMSSASAPRTSPTMMRSGRMRSALITRSRAVIRPRPSMLTGRVSMRTTCSWSRISSAVSSIVTMRSVSGIASASAPSSVDLPAPVPPEIRMFLRARTAMTRNSSISRRERPEAEQVVAPQALAAEAADRDRRTVDRHRRQRRVDAAAVGQAQVGHRRRGVDAAADARGDALDDAHDVLGVAEAHVGALEPAEALDVHLVRRVDEDVGDGRIGQQRRQRTHADRLVGQLLGQPDALGLVERRRPPTRSPAPRTPGPPRPRRRRRSRAARARRSRRAAAPAAPP